MNQAGSGRSGKMLSTKEASTFLHHSLKNREASAGLQIPPADGEEYCTRQRVAALPLGRTFPRA